MEYRDCRARAIYVAANNKVYAFKVPFPAMQLTSTVSRKVHGDAGPFDIILPAVECRSDGAGGDYTLVFTFSNNIESGNASVTSGPAVFRERPRLPETRSQLT